MPTSEKSSATPLPVPEAFVSVLTAPTPGAIGVVGVRGPGALVAVEPVFRPTVPGPLRESTVRFGHLGPGAGDEVLVVVGSGPAPTVEVQCHGGTAAIRMVVQTLLATGAQPAEPLDWLVPADSTRAVAEASTALPHASTARAAGVLLDHLQGAWDRECHTLASQLAREPQAVRQRVRTLLDRRAPVVKGEVVAIAGRPNVGKSRLLNALAGFDRAIVSPVPGTTRDVLRVATAIGGWPVELFDTAGQRHDAEASGAIEREGIRRALAARAEAGVVLLLLDRSEPLTPLDDTLLHSLDSAIRVASKCDLDAAWDASLLDAIPVSAATGAGLEALQAAILSRIEPQPIAPGELVPVWEWQRQALRHLEQALAGGDEPAAAQILRQMSESGRFDR